MSNVTGSSGESLFNNLQSGKSFSTELKDKYQDHGKLDVPRLLADLQVVVNCREQLPSTDNLDFSAIPHYGLSEQDQGEIYKLGMKIILGSQLAEEAPWVDEILEKLTLTDSKSLDHTLITMMKKNNPEVNHLFLNLICFIPEECHHPKIFHRLLNFLQEGDVQDPNFAKLLSSLSINNLIIFLSDPELVDLHILKDLSNHYPGAENQYSITQTIHQLTRLPPQEKQMMLTQLKNLITLFPVRDLSDILENLSKMNTVEEQTDFINCLKIFNIPRSSKIQISSLKEFITSLVKVPKQNRIAIAEQLANIAKNYKLMDNNNLFKSSLIINDIRNLSPEECKLVLSSASRLTDKLNCENPQNVFKEIVEFFSTIPISESKDLCDQFCYLLDEIKFACRGYGSIDEQMARQFQELLEITANCPAPERREVLHKTVEFVKSVELSKIPEENSENNKIIEDNTVIIDKFNRTLEFIVNVTKSSNKNSDDKNFIIPLVKKNAEFLNDHGEIIVNYDIGNWSDMYKSWCDLYNSYLELPDPKGSQKLLEQLTDLISPKFTSHVQNISTLMTILTPLKLLEQQSILQQLQEIKPHLGFYPAEKFLTITKALIPMTPTQREELLSDTTILLAMLGFSNKFYNHDLVFNHLERLSKNERADLINEVYQQISTTEPPGDFNDFIKIFLELPAEERKEIFQSARDVLQITPPPLQKLTEMVAILKNIPGRERQELLTHVKNLIEIEQCPEDKNPPHLAIPDFKLIVESLTPVTSEQRAHTVEMTKNLLLLLPSSSLLTTLNFVIALPADRRQDIYEKMNSTLASIHEEPLKEQVFSIEKIILKAGEFQLFEKCHSETTEKSEKFWHDAAPLLFFCAATYNPHISLTAFRIFNSIPEEEQQETLSRFFTLIQEVPQPTHHADSILNLFELFITLPVDKQNALVAIAKGTSHPDVLSDILEVGALFSLEKLIEAQREPRETFMGQLAKIRAGQIGDNLLNYLPEYKLQDTDLILKVIEMASARSQAMQLYAFNENNVNKIDPALLSYYTNLYFSSCLTRWPEETFKDYISYNYAEEEDVYQLLLKPLAHQEQIDSTQPTPELHTYNFSAFRKLQRRNTAVYEQAYKQLGFQFARDYQMNLSPLIHTMRFKKEKESGELVPQTEYIQRQGLLWLLGVYCSLDSLPNILEELQKKPFQIENTVTTMTKDTRAKIAKESNISNIDIKELLQKGLTSCYAIHNPELRGAMTNMVVGVLLCEEGKRDLFLKLYQKQSQPYLFLPYIAIANLLTEDMEEAFLEKLAEEIAFGLGKDLKNYTLNEALLRLAVYCSDHAELKTDDVKAIWNLSGISEKAQLEGKIQEYELLSKKYLAEIKRYKSSHKAETSTQKRLPKAKVVKRGAVTPSEQAATEKPLGEEPHKLTPEEQLNFSQQSLSSCQNQQQELRKTVSSATASLKSRLNNLRAIGELGVPLALTQELLAQNVSNGDELLDYFLNLFRKTIPVSPSKDFLNRFDETFSQSRDPTAILRYAASLSKLPKDERVTATEALAKYVDSALQGEEAFSSQRVQTSDNPHLTAIFGAFPDLAEQWTTAAQVPLLERVPEAKAQAPLTETLYAKIITEDHLNGYANSYIRDYLTNSSEEGKATISAALTEELAKHPSDQQPEELLAQKLLMEMTQPHFAKRNITQKIEHLKTIGKLYNLNITCEFNSDLHLMQSLFNSPLSQRSLENYTVVDTDHPIDLLLCGTEIQGSCQRVDGNPNLNKGLLGYLLDGKTRMVAVKNGEGKSEARALLRLLWNEDKNTPVLCLSRLYQNNNTSPSFSNAIIRQALLKAQNMGVPLVSHYLATNQELGNRFNDSLVGLGGPAPFEYVDEAQMGQVQHQGRFKLMKQCYYLTPIASVK